MDRHEDELIKDTFKACPYLPKDYKVEPVKYEFTLTNAFGHERLYTVYYAIIPPIK